MNEEIKKILDRIKNYPEKLYCLNETEKSILLDYITNLQQKVDLYENPDDMTLFYMWLDEKSKDKMKQLQQENERLKEKNILLKASEPMSKIAEDYGYKSRIDKAIEILKLCNSKCAKETINILNGSDEND